MIKVTCAIIERGSTILCAQRSEKMKLPLKWEFPGGKVEGDESLDVCLVREIHEELGIEIEVLEKMPSNIHAYEGGKGIELIPFRCKITRGEPQLKEHKQILWLNKKALLDLDWAEADIPIVKNYIQL